MKRCRMDMSDYIIDENDVRSAFDIDGGSLARSFPVLWQAFLSLDKNLENAFPLRCREVFVALRRDRGGQHLVESAVDSIAQRDGLIVANAMYTDYKKNVAI